MGGPSANDAITKAPSDRIRVLRELGSPAGADVACCAALDAGGGRTRLVVVERVMRPGSVGAQDVATWLEHARRLVPLEHPNVARVRDAIDGAGDAYVVSDYIDGARWSDVVAAGSGMALDVAVRVLLDVLAGLGAFHNMRDAARQPLGLVHARLTSESVLLGLDGVSRILGTARLRGTFVGTGAHYLAPEVLLEDDAADARADVYSVGVLLWEAMSGRPLFTETGASAIVTAVLSGRIPRAEAPASAPWAVPLVDVAARALSPDPAKRYASAAAMAAELRRVGGAKIVPSIRVAALVRSSFGDRIKARREELERGEVFARVVSGTAVIASRAAGDDAGPRSDAPTPVPVAPTPTATTRPPPPLGGEAGHPPAPIPPMAVPNVPLTLPDPPTTVDPLAANGTPTPVATPAAAPRAKPAFAAPTQDEEEMTLSNAKWAPSALRLAEVAPPPATPEGARTLEPSIVASPRLATLDVRRKRVIVLAAAAAALIVLIAGAAVLFGGGTDEARDPGTAAATRSATSAPTATATTAPPAAATLTATASTTSPAAPPATAAPTVSVSASASAQQPTPEPSVATEAPPAPAPMPKPKPVIKYDPQGI